jgi:hypothetical protein
MKKIGFFTGLMILASLSWAQAGGDRNVKPLSAEQIQVTTSSYNAVNLSQRWLQLAQKEPKVAGNWLNAALWTRRNYQLTESQKEQQYQQLAQQSKRHIGNTGEWMLISYLEGGRKDTALLGKAYEKMDNKITPLVLLVQDAVRFNDAIQKRNRCRQLQELQPINKGTALYWYHYNVLQSAPANATILARGENDLVPLALLQEIWQVRTDIKLKYFDENKVVNTGEFLCLSLGQQELEMYRTKGRITGLLLEAFPLQDSAYRQQVWPAAIETDYLEKEIFYGIQAQLHKNYLPGLLLLYKHFFRLNDDRKEKYKNIILKIGTEAYIREQVQQQLSACEQ